MSLTDTSVASGKCAPQQPAHAVVASQDTAATDLGQSVLTASSAPSVVARTPPDRSVIGPGTNVSSAPRWAPPELHTTAGGSVSPLPARSAGGAFQGSNVAHQYPTGGVQSSEASSGMPGARQHGLSSNWAVAGGASAPDATAATTSRGLESEHTSHERTLTEFPAQFPPMLHMSSHEDKGSMGATPPVTAGALHARQGSAGSEVRQRSSFWFGKSRGRRPRLLLLLYQQASRPHAAVRAHRASKHARRSLSQQYAHACVRPMRCAAASHALMIHTGDASGAGARGAACGEARAQGAGAALPLAAGEAGGGAGPRAAHHRRGDDGVRGAAGMTAPLISAG